MRKPDIDVDADRPTLAIAPSTQPRGMPRWPRAGSKTFGLETMTDTLQHAIGNLKLVQELIDAGYIRFERRRIGKLEFMRQHDIVRALFLNIGTLVPLPHFASAALQRSNDEDSSAALHRSRS